MSVSSFARLVLGYRFPRSAITRTTMVRDCDHALPANAAFCPTCGKPASREATSLIFYDGDRRLAPFGAFHGNVDPTMPSRGYGGVIEDYFVVGVNQKGFAPVQGAPDGALQLKLDLEIKLSELGADVSKGTFGYHIVHYFG